MRRVVPALLLLAAIACNERPAADVSQAGSPTEAAAVRAHVDSVNANISRWVDGGHADSVAAAYVADAWLQAPNSTPVVGRDSILTMWRGMNGMGKWRLVPRAQDVVVRGDVAVERGTYEMSFERAANAAKAVPPSFSDRGGYVVLWVKEGDRWLLKWDIGSSSLPPGGATAK